MVDHNMVETMRDLVAQIGVIMETAFGDERDVTETLQQLLGELAAAGASLQGTAIQKKNMDGLTLSEIFWVCAILGERGCDIISVASPAGRHLVPCAS